MIGYVYLMINPAFPDLIKIGRTSKSSDARALELSTTGAPSKFIVAFDILVDDCVEIESEMHAIFSSSRHAENREFFRLPLKNAIETLQDISKNRTVDKELLLADSSNSDSWQSDKVTYYFYCIFIGEINTKSHEYFLPKNRFFRFGLVSREIDDKTEDATIDEIKIKNKLNNDLINYYSNFGWYDFNDSKIRIHQDAFLKYLLFHELFEISRSQRKKMETIIKEILAQKIDKENSLGWKIIFDGQSILHLPYAYNDIGAQAIYGEILSSLEEYYYSLKLSDKEKNINSQIKEAQSKTGNF
jgi:hypothetical protein